MFMLQYGSNKSCLRLFPHPGCLRAKLHNSWGGRMPRSGGTGEGFRIIGDSNNVDNDNILWIINLHWNNHKNHKSHNYHEYHGDHKFQNHYDDHDYEHDYVDYRFHFTPSGWVGLSRSPRRRMCHRGGLYLYCTCIPTWYQFSST